MSAAESLAHIRAELEKRFGSAILPPGLAAGEVQSGFTIGVQALDRLVPEGVPRGLLSVWAGTATSGRTAAMRCLVAEACGTGARVGLVDATRSLDAGAWCGAGGEFDGLWVVRPPDAERGREGAWVGESLLRTGAFDLVVIDGPPPDQQAAHRLRRLARETDAALVISCEHAPSGWRSDLLLEFRRTRTGSGLRVGGRFRRRVRIEMAKGWGGRTGDQEVEVVEEPAHCMHTGPPVPDRRPRRGE